MKGLIRGESTYRGFSAARSSRAAAAKEYHQEYQVRHGEAYRPDNGDT
jgi:hypothetical protein